MTKKDKDEWVKRQESADAGYDPKPWRGVQLHGQNTLRHEYVKFLLCWLLDQKDREWDTEVQMEEGRVDVFDFGPPDGDAVVYEVETGVTKKRAREKVNQYVGGPIRDVIVIDPADVPLDPEEGVEYLDKYEVLG